MNGSDWEDVLELVASGTVTANTLAQVGDNVGMYLNSGASGDTVSFKISGLIKNATKVATQVWVSGDRLYWVTASSAFTNIPNGLPCVGWAAKAALSAAVLGDVILAGTPTVGTERIVITSELLAASVDKWAFIADRAYKVVSVRSIQSVVGGSSAAVSPRKILAANVSAPGAAVAAGITELVTAACDLTSTANTAVTATLTATIADRSLAAGDKIGLDFSGTLTGLVGLISIELQAI